VLFKDKLFAGAVSGLNAEIGSNVIIDETGMLSEAQWMSADGNQIIALSVSATFEGNVTAEKAYNDTAGWIVWTESLDTAGKENN
jgi:hypothetical protein